MKETKKIQGAFALLMAVSIALLLIGCPDKEDPIKGPSGPVEHTITVLAAANTNGSVVPNKTKAFKGDVITLTIKAASGYRLSTNTLRWSSGGTNNTIDPANPKFTMPDGNVTITATWVSESVSYEFSISAAEGITASQPGGNGGENITVTVSHPRPELSLIEGSLTFNGEPITGTSFTMPYENVFINGLFEYKNWRTDLETPALFGPRKFVSLEDVDDAPINAFIAQMTNGQKGGQMVQSTRGHTGSGSGTLGGDSLGSILSGGGEAPNPNNPTSWVNSINAYQAAADASTRKIPLMYGVDAVHGHNTLPSATVFPQNIAMGAYAVGDVKGAMEDMYKAGSITAEEMLWTGCNWTFAPCVTPSVDVRWGRTYESFGEDIEVSSAMAVAIVRGLQDHGVAATLKHFYAENHTTNGQNANQAELNYAEMAPHLEPFRAGVQLGGAYTMMPTMGSVNLNGTGMRALHEHSYLMSTVTKGTGPNAEGMGENFGFKGFIITDYNAGGNATAANAGIDMAMRNDNATGVRTTFSNLQAARLNDAVLRILRVKTAMGLMKVEGGTLVPVPQRYTAGTLPDEDHRAVAREIAAKTITLLKNDNNALAKLAAAENILLLGQAAANIGLQCGGWTESWQGGSGVSTTGVNIRQGIEEKGKNVTLSNNTSGNATAAIAGTYDAIVAVLGESPHSENAGDRPSGNIIIRTGGNNQDAAGNFNDVGMLRAAYDYKLDNPDVPLIVIMMSARPMRIADPVYTGNTNQGHPLYGEPHYEQWDAFIAAWLPGNMGGGAIADVIFDADKDFVAKTPLTWRTTYSRTGSGGTAGWRNPYPEDSVIYPYGWGLTKKAFN